MEFSKENLRTVLANERTFAAWIRTGLAFLAAGIAGAQFYQNQWFHPLILWVATVLVIFSGLCFIFSSVHFFKLETRLLTKAQKGVPHIFLFILSFFLVLISLFTIFILWNSTRGL